MFVAGIVSGVANSGSYDITQIDGTNGLTSHKRFGIGLYSDHVRGFFFLLFVAGSELFVFQLDYSVLVGSYCSAISLRVFFLVEFIVSSFVFVCYCCLSCDHFWYCSLPTWHRTWIPA